MQKQYENGVARLLLLAQINQGFELGKILTDTPREILEEFEEEWIALVRQREDGLSRKDLKNPSESEKAEDAEDLADDWSILERQIAGSDFMLERTDEWYFTLSVHKADKKSFRLPYDPVAMSVCNRLIQHYNNP